jgi:hypothetical protein
VFARDCALDDAQAVCAGDGVDRAQVAALLDDLVCNSLVDARVVSGRTRYSLLETLREYGAERLAARGEHERLAERHADHYVTRARRVIDRGWRESKLPFVDEFHELRAAVRWCERDERPDRAFTLVEVLWWPALSRHAEETARLAEETLERWPAIHPLRPRALGAASVARLVIGDVEAAQRHADGALALEAGLGEAALLARRTLAQIAFFRGDLLLAAVRWHDLTYLARATGYEGLVCEATGFTVQLLHADGRFDAAAALAAEMRDAAERLASPMMVAWSRYVSGVALLEREPAEARRWLEGALAFAREADHHHMIRFSLRALGVGASLRGDHAEASARLLAALEYDEARSDAASQWTTLLAIADVLLERGRLDAAAELLGATEPWPAAPFLRALAARACGRLSDRLDALERGRWLDLEAAKALARAEL